MAHFLADYFWGNFVWFSSRVGSRGPVQTGERNSPTSETGWWGGMPGNRAEFTGQRPALWMGFPGRADNGVPRGGEGAFGFVLGHSDGRVTSFCGPAPLQDVKP